MKTSELQGAALDWAVAKYVYPDLVWGSRVCGRSIGIHHASHQIVIPHLPDPKCYWNPSTDWAQGGPIIEREKIRVTPFPPSREHEGWNAGIYDKQDSICGPTPLIAAMRCYVASKLGDTVEIPEELK